MQADAPGSLPDELQFEDRRAAGAVGLTVMRDGLTVAGGEQVQCVEDGEIAEFQWPRRRRRTEIGNKGQSPPPVQAQSGRGLADGRRIGNLTQGESEILGIVESQAVDADGEQGRRAGIGQNVEDAVAEVLPESSPGSPVSMVAMPAGTPATVNSRRIAEYVEGSGRWMAAGRFQAGWASSRQGTRALVEKRRTASLAFTGPTSLRLPDVHPECIRSNPGDRGERA